MYQQINLYQPVFRRQRKIFSAATLLSILVMATLLLLVVYAQARWTQQGLQRTSAELSLHVRQLDARLAALEASAANGAQEAAGDDILQLGKRIGAYSALLEHIDRLALETADGFGEIFETLARQNVPGLWLTGVSVDRAGNTEIRGATLDPKLVPRYLHLMTQQQRLATLASVTVNLMRHAPDQPEINFILSDNAQGTLP
jgi:Tfp pilus assembly protein PilN